MRERKIKGTVLKQMPANRDLKWKALSMPQAPYGRRKGTPANALHSDESWEEERETIHGLWKVNSLKEVARKMAQRGFVTTETMIKNRLHKWGYRKYDKPDENKNQLLQFVQKVKGKLGRGKTPSRRRAPPNVSGLLPHKNHALVQKCAEILDDRVAEQLEYSYLDELNVDRRDNSQSAAPNHLPDTVNPNDLTRTAYSGSTGQGSRTRRFWLKLVLRGPFAPRSPAQANALSDISSTREPSTPTTLQPAPPVLNDSPGEATSSGPSKSVTLVPSSHPRTLCASSTEVKSKSVAEEADEMQWTHDMTWMETSDHCGNSMWSAATRWNIFGDPWPKSWRNHDSWRNHHGSTTLLHFAPRVIIHNSTGRMVLKTIASTRHSLLFKNHNDYLTKGTSVFMKFIELFGRTHQLFRREIDINDCPDRGNIFAVDLLGWHKCIQRQLDTKTKQLMIAMDTKDLCCFAWCVRRADEWNHWLRQLESFGNPQNVFACGHSLEALTSDGPVIFTVVLKPPCWQEGGCQWCRIEEDRTHGFDAETYYWIHGDRSHWGGPSYVPWSSTSATLAKEAM